MQSPQIVIIGAGVLGCSAAYHFAARDRSRILVIDRGPKAGMGSTGKATGGFRAQFGSQIGVWLSLLSRKKLLKFSEETGVDPEYDPAGYLMIAEDDAGFNLLQDAVKLQREAGLDQAQIVSTEEILRLNPALAADN